MKSDPSKNGGEADERLADVLEQILHGEGKDASASAEQLLASHPELAGDLESCLRAIAYLGSVGRGGAPPPRRAGESTEADPHVLGDYRVLREIGRGGMGIVFEALERSLGRRVALKVLPWAALLDTRQRQRFHNEARLAAQLHHTNIVPVFSVGTEQGIDYYAMQYIDGEPLAAWMERQSGSRRDSIEAVVSLGIQAADALAYAHQMGVIHRDIKPANLLVDRTGKLWITDFGVARSQSPLGLTATGDRVGTLRYMSPEQFSGGPIDHRTDIYALGVTLQELLTPEPNGSPPTGPVDVSAADASKAALHSSIKGRMPRDLETILRKSTAPARDDRYPNAHEMADDLGRFLRGEPISAQRTGLVTLGAKWIMRHRRLAAVCLLATVLTLAGLAVTTVVIATERNAAEAAVERERLAAAQAEKERQRAEANFQKARAAVDRVFTRVAEEMEGQPHMEQIRGRLLEDALEFYKDFAKQKSGDDAVLHDTALAYLRVGRIYRLLGNYDSSFEPLEHARMLLEGLTKRYPAQPQYRVEMAETYAHMAYANLWADRIDEAIGQRRRELALLVALNREFPTVPKYLQMVIDTRRGIGGLLDDGGYRQEAVHELQRALALYDKMRADFPSLPEDREALAEVHHWLGESLAHVDRKKEAEQSYRRSHELRTQLVAEQPHNALANHHLSHIKAYLAGLLMHTGRPAEAVTLLEEATDIDEKLLKDFPNDADYRRRAIADQSTLGDALFAARRIQEAETALRRSVAIRAKFAADTPGAPTYFYHLAWGHYELGQLLHRTGQTGEAAESFRESLRIFEKVATKFPEIANYQNHLGWVLATCPTVQFRDPHRAVKLANRALQLEPADGKHWGLLGIAQFRAGDARAAINALDKAVELLYRDDTLVWFFLAMGHWQLGQKDEARNWYDRSVEWMEKNQPTDYEFVRFRDEAERLMGIKQPDPTSQGAPQGEDAPKPKS